MPYIKVNKTKLYYEDTAPKSKKPVIFFAHGLLWSCRMWDEQVKVLKKHYRCISMDFRGQGHSAVSRTGYDMDTLATDVQALLDKLGVDKFHFVGLSMGGFVGQRVALALPSRVQSLILLDTSADPEPKENIKGYKRLARAASILGARAVMGEVAKVMHGKTFLERAKTDRKAKRKLKKFINMMSGNRRRAIRKTVGGVITREGVYDRIHAISQPTLVIVGDEDVATTLEKAQRIHMQIPCSKLAIVEQAGHMSPMEQPEKVTQLINTFLAKHVV